MIKIKNYLVKILYNLNLLVYCVLRGYIITNAVIKIILKEILQRPSKEEIQINGQEFPEEKIAKTEHKNEFDTQEALLPLKAKYESNFSEKVSFIFIFCLS